MNVPLRPTAWPANADPVMSSLPPVAPPIAPLAMPKQVLTPARLGVVHVLADWIVRIWPGLRPAG